MLERLAVPAGAGGHRHHAGGGADDRGAAGGLRRGVSADSQTLRQYPNGSLAAHSLGYVGPVNQDELDAARKAGRTDLHLNAQIGRAGLEKTYDADLRGNDGVRYVTVDNRGTRDRHRSGRPSRSAATRW